MAFAALAVFSAQGNSVSVTETYADRLVSYSDGEGGKYFEVVPSGRFTARIVVKQFPGEDGLARGEDVDISLNIGGWSFSEVLPAGRSSKRFVIPGGAVVASRIAGGVVITASGRTTEGSPAADMYAGGEPGVYRLNPSEDRLDVSVAAGVLSRAGDFGMRGKATTKRVVKGSGEYEEEFYLTSVGLSVTGRFSADY